jgi:hypothetical protein
LEFRTILSVFLRVVQLLTQLFWVWITLDWKVRKARKAFEKELVLQGVSKEDAKRLSKQIKILKDHLMNSIWQSALYRKFPGSQVLENLRAA